MTEKQVQDNSSSDEIDIVKYLLLLKRRSCLIFVLVLATAAVSSLWSLTLERKYRAMTTITPVQESRSPASMASSLLGNLAGSFLSSGGDVDELTAVLNSDILAKTVIEQYSLMPVLFYKQWDKKTNQWRKPKIGIVGNTMNAISEVLGSLTTKVKSLLGQNNDSDLANKKAQSSAQPTINDALRAFKSIYKVSVEGRNIIALSVEYNDPEKAADILNSIIVVLGQRITEETKKAAMINKKYLEEQLITTSDPILKNKIYNLIAQQIEMSMMAEVTENSAYKVIDPPMAPDQPIYPHRKKIVLTSVMTCLFLSSMIVLIKEAFRDIRKQAGKQ
ncbi:lipopolysaccharide biosynthesis protein [Candidatus Magnetoovum chiemensis]|nr:lipopolysaccharide biosynthesis protein [Candidatus Magnetoovum chiemensis]